MSRITILSESVIFNEWHCSGLRGHKTLHDQSLESIWLDQKRASEAVVDMQMWFAACGSIWVRQSWHDSKVNESVVIIIASQVHGVSRWLNWPALMDMSGDWSRIYSSGHEFKLRKKSCIKTQYKRDQIKTKLGSQKSRQPTRPHAADSTHTVKVTHILWS